MQTAQSMPQGAMRIVLNAVFTAIQGSWVSGLLIRGGLCCAGRCPVFLLYLTPNTQFSRFPSFLRWKKWQINNQDSGRMRGVGRGKL